MPQNLELDQLLKDGCTFVVLDQPVSLDRIQLKNIDQLNASGNVAVPPVHSLWPGALMISTSSSSLSMDQCVSC